MVGIGALLTKKKLKCTLCGEYNDTGTAKPWTGPDSKRAAKKFGTDELDAPAPKVAAPTAAPAATPSLADELGKLAALRDSGALTEDEFAAQKARLLPG